MATTTKKQIIPTKTYRNTGGPITNYVTPFTYYEDYHFGAMEDPATGQKLTPMRHDGVYEEAYYPDNDFTQVPWDRNLPPPSPGFDVITKGQKYGLPTLFVFELITTP